MFFCYYNFSKRNSLTQSEILRNIGEEVDDLFKEDAALLKYLGDVIIKHNKYNNITEISYLLTATGDSNIKSLTTSYISWADDKGIITVSGKAGILKDKTKNILSRDYYRTAREHPWTLKLSSISKSIFSSKLVLPTAMGITNTSGEFLGYLVLGLNVAELEKHLKLRFLKNGYHFLVVDNESGGVLIASDETLINQPELLKDKIWQQGFTHNGNVYDFNEIIKHYNLSVFVGYNKKLYLYAFFQEIFPQFIEIFVFLFFLVLLLSFFKNKIIVPIKRLSESVEKILKERGEGDFKAINIKEIDKLSDGLSLLQKYIKQNTQKSDLLTYTNHLTELSSTERENYYKGIVEKVREDLNDVSLCLNLVISEHDNIGNDSAFKLINHTSELVEKAQNLFATGKKSYFHINSLLDECVSFYLKEIQQHSIDLIKGYEQNLPLYHGDRFQLKHIIICIINNTLKEKNIQNAQVVLDTKYENYETYENISIHIKAITTSRAPSRIRKEPYPLDAKEIGNDKDKNKNKDNNFIEDDIEFIRRRAEEEGLKLKVNTMEENVKEWVLNLTITEPYPEEEEFEMGDNIVHFKSYQFK